MNFSRSDLLKWNVAATLWTWPSRNWFSNEMNDMTAIWSGKFLSLILQKHGEEEGWTTERAGFEATGILRARLPTVKRTKGHGSIVSSPSLLWYFFYFEKTLLTLPRLEYNAYYHHSCYNLQLQTQTFILLISLSMLSEERVRLKTETLSLSLSEKE